MAQGKECWGALERKPHNLEDAGESSGGGGGSGFSGRPNTKYRGGCRVANNGTSTSKDQKKKRTYMQKSWGGWERVLKTGRVWSGARHEKKRKHAESLTGVGGGKKN